MVFVFACRVVLFVYGRPSLLVVVLLVFVVYCHGLGFVMLVSRLVMFSVC